MLKHRIAPVLLAAISMVFSRPSLSQQESRSQPGRQQEKILSTQREAISHLDFMLGTWKAAVG